MFMPSEDNWKEIAKEFYIRWNFPHCIGAVDGKHVVITVNIFVNIFKIFF